MPTYRTAANTFAIQATQYDTGAALNSAGAVCGAYFGPEAAVIEVDARALSITPRLASRLATNDDVQGLVGIDDPYSLNFLPADTVDFLLNHPGHRIFLAEDPSGILAWGLTIEQSDLSGPFIWFDRITNRTRLYDGVDVDGDPVLSALAIECFGVLLKRFTTYYASLAITRCKYRCPDKLFQRLAAIYSDPRFGMTVTINVSDLVAGQRDVEVTFA